MTEWTVLSSLCEITQLDADARDVARGRRRVVCWNDAADIGGDFEECRARMDQAFSARLPDVSAFEINTGGSAG